jgi:hypothetical protein
MSQPDTYFCSFRTITQYIHSLPSVCLLIRIMTIFRFQIHPLFYNTSIILQSFTLLRKTATFERLKFSRIFHPFNYNGTTLHAGLKSWISLKCSRWLSLVRYLGYHRMNTWIVRLLQMRHNLNITLYQPSDSVV